ncbi:hypothetical protein K443DRAFT_188962 [Laccaria amethystina LaAM-08-1]|jgi:hypothetical protein|uniref:Uncharacterized protein n=1 Tax=Laccaria amethystina LaAM-08-1 TaxID=1095629 RepID=A0A0C9XND3_9AGAR|nr:hypothetical protein K443DRAFT_188962 [Laccaria amethystina LaAM-08-1]
MAVVRFAFLKVSSIGPPVLKPGWSFFNLEPTSFVTNNYGMCSSDSFCKRPIVISCRRDHFSVKRHSDNSRHLEGDIHTSLLCQGDAGRLVLLSFLGVAAPRFDHTSPYYLANLGSWRV